MNVHNPHPHSNSDHPQRPMAVRGRTSPSRVAQREAHMTAMRACLDALVEHPLLRVDGLTAGYGATEVLHAVDLRVGAGQSLCLVGPIGGGKSTVLHSIFGLTDI